MTDKELDIQLPILQSRIPYDEDVFGNEDIYNQVLEDLLNDSKSICLEVIFPYEDFSEYDLPLKYYNWQIRCCIELYNLADKQGIASYSENNLSWTKYTDGLSKDLMSKLVAKVGIPKGDSNV